MHSSEKGENGTEQHECLPDDALSEGSAESREVCVPIVIPSTREQPDVFFDPDRSSFHERFPLELALKRVLAGLVTLQILLSLSACRLTGRLPYYRETNDARPADAAPYEVRREGIDVHALVDLKSQRQGRVNTPIDFVFGVAKAWLPKDVAKKNRKKVERMMGRPLVREEVWDPVVTDPFPDVDVILALSGGGHRAANLSSAVMFELSRVPLKTSEGRSVTLLDTVDTVSSVSGGGFAAAFYIYHRSVFRENLDPKKAELHLHLIQVGMRENIQRRLLDALILPVKVSYWIRTFTRANRSNLYSNLLEYRIIRPQRIESWEAKIYPKWWRKSKLLAFLAPRMMDLIWIASPLTPDDQYLFGVKAHTFDDLYLQDPEDPDLLYPLRPEWLINATAYNEPVEENQFIFDEERFNRFQSDWLDYRISDAVATSAAFPVMLVPLALRDWKSGEPRWLFLFDGGVSDNQGMNGVRVVLERQAPGRRTIVIMVDASPSAGAIESKNANRPSGLAVSNRALERYMDSMREQTVDELEALEEKGNLRFFHMAVRPEEFGAPLSDEAEAAFETANAVPTALKISRDDQEALFEVGGLLVDRDREAMLDAIKAPATPPLP